MLQRSTIPWLLGLALAAGPPGGAEAQEERVHMGRAFLFEVDLDGGVHRGWLPPDHDADAVLDGIARAMQARLRSSGRFVEAVVAREEGGHLTANFVGPLGAGFDDFLQEALATPGRLELWAEARGAEVEGEPPPPCPCAAEVPAGAGWPHPVPGPRGEVLWIRPPGGAPVALAAASRLPLARRSAERGLVPMGTASDERYDVDLELTTAAGRELARWREAWAGRRAFLLIDDAVSLATEVDRVGTGARGTSGGALVRVAEDLSLEELRPLLFAFAGEPYPAPLTFLEFVLRPLPSTK